MCSFVQGVFALFGIRLIRVRDLAALEDRMIKAEVLCANRGQAIVLLQHALRGKILASQ